MDKFKATLDYSIKQAELFPSISEIWLYGSYARNENTPQSDVDLFIVTETHLDGKDKIKIKNTLCPDDYHLPEVDVHFGVLQKKNACSETSIHRSKSADSTEKAGSAAENLFLKNVQKDGKLVYQAK